MKPFLYLLLSGLFLAAAPGFADAAKVDRELLTTYDEEGDNALLSVNITMAEQADANALIDATKGMSREARRRTAIHELRSLAGRSQADLLSYLSEKEQIGEAAEISALWIVNLVNARVTRRVAEELARRDDVAWIGYNRMVYALSALARGGKNEGTKGIVNALAGSGGELTPAANDTAWGVLWIDAPAAWQMGYKGRNVLVAILDTGIWYLHPDLENRIWNNPGEVPNDGIDNDGNGYVDDYHGFDFNTHTPDPLDGGIGHGTHVSGTVAGDGSAGILTGVAPEAILMGCKVLDDLGYGDEADTWEGIQYAVDNGAHVLQGSIGWIHSVHNPDRSTWRSTCDNVLAAGAIMSFAGGNERGYYSPPDDIRTPGDCPPPWHNPDQTLTGGRSAVVAVGATGYHTDNIAYFSSYGPTSWENIAPYFDYPYQPEMGLLKPDVCAPGDLINSTVVGGGYSGDTWSGTSMATPHNSGLIALMLSKNMAMSPETIDNILETTALDRGPAGKDNDYGAGRIQADLAVSRTPELAGVTLAMVPSDSVVAPGGSLTITITFENTLSTPLTFDFWIMVKTPWGVLIELVPPTSLTLDGFETVSTDEIFPIPGGAPDGDYIVVGIIGGYPAQAMDKDRFVLTITP